MNNPFLQGKASNRSLNRATIVTLDGINPPDGILGLRGYPSLSAAYLLRKIRAQAPHLNLNPDSPALIADLENAFSDPVFGHAAGRIAQDFGIQLGYLLLMLKRGDAANRAARPDWTDEHWTYWANVENVIFGGGVMGGRFGRKALFAATNLLATHGYPHVNLQLSPYRGDIGLVGLARAVDVKSALAFDFGQTSVKRAVAQLSKDGIALEPMPSLPANCYKKEGGNLLGSQARWEWMLDVISTSWQPVEAIGISIATYLDNGYLSPTHTDCYGCLHELTDYLPTFMQNQLRKRHAIDIPITIIHDGTAAAAAHTDFNGVVITVGTALGVGFPEEMSARQFTLSTAN